MRRFSISLFTLLLITLTSISAKALGWPANYDGVMLQGFYWDSYKETTWKQLTAQSDELSKYFDLIWVPNSGKAQGEPTMGYYPIYWFTNHNSSFGTEAELNTMISTFKKKGTGIIADCILNHRVGVSDWYDFPSETWNGKTYKMANGSICSDDEVWSSKPSTPSSYRGNSDTGEGEGGARDLDHTNATVQEHCADYVKCLLQKYGYAGVRYDKTKGYSGKYNGQYNQAAGVEFSVGEFWDASYDAVAGWIEATGKRSAAFDFPLKYQLNKAMGGGENLTELVWKANGTKEQPAGLIHYGYPQYSVTFVDNHDTYRDGSKYTGDVMKAYAFILMSPGTPCVFWPHYTKNKSAIQKLIDIRKNAGIHNCSPVNVLKSTSNCYAAEVTGTKGKVIVKVGSDTSFSVADPSYKLVASGNGYAVWAKDGGGVTPDPTPVPGGSAPSELYILGNIEGKQWTTNDGIKMVKSGNRFSASNVKLVAAQGETNAFFTFVTKLGSDWDNGVNTGDRYGATSKDYIVNDGGSAAFQIFPANISASSANSWGISPGTYNIVADFDNMTMTVSSKEIGGGNTSANMPSTLYVLGNINGYDWSTTEAISMTKRGDTFVAENVTVDSVNEGYGYFSFVTALGSDWDAVNQSDRYGAATKDEPLSIGGEAALVCYPANVSASGANSWMVVAGQYDIMADFASNKVKISIPSTNGIDEIEENYDSDIEPVYYNLQGLEVQNPSGGIYIVVRGNKVSKEYIR